jgi:uncharacterized protein YggE
MLVRAAVALVLALAAQHAVAQVNALPPTRHILVYGDAQARAIPDRFKITIDFSAVDLNAGAARSRVETSVQEVVGRLRQAGVDDREIVATSLRMGTKERYDDELDEDVFLGTEVERSLSALFSDKGALESFLSGLETSSELAVSKVETELSDERSLRAALRTKAVESSREKAETIAQAYGARLGSLYSVSDVAPQFQYGIREGSWPSMYEWVRGADGDGTSLDRIMVTGSRMQNSNPVSLQTGYVNFNDKIYAVFLLAD